MRFSILGLSALAAATILSGCVSGYKSQYQPTNGATPEFIASLRAAPPGVPKVERVSGRIDQSLYDSYQRRGYWPIGYAHFTSARGQSDEAAVEQARAVGADIVTIVTPTHAGTVTTHIPITVPTTTTAHTNSTATAWGRGGTVNAVGQATTTIHGTQTNIIPVTVNHTNYGAVYFVKIRMPLGVQVRALNDAERAELQTNKGVVVLSVVNGSPAFEADVLVGDIIFAIGDQSVSMPESLRPVLDANRGKTVRIKMSRAGKSLEKDIQLGS